MRSLLFALLLAPMLAFAGDVTLSWQHDGKNTNGSPATLAGFTIVYGTNANTLSQRITLSNPALRSYVITGLAPGTWYFGALASDTTGGSSALSNVVSKVIAAPPPAVPSAPTNLQVTVTSLTAYTVIKRVDRFVMLPVGTVPADTTCDPTQQVNGYFAVPRAKVQWAGNVQPDVVVAQCS